MWSTIENFRESLSQITSEVLDAAEELEVGGSEQPGPDTSSRFRLRQAQGDNHVSTQQNGKENHAPTAGSSAKGFLPKLKELQVHNRKLQAREKELLNDLSAKSLEYASLENARGKVLEEMGNLKDSFMKQKEELTSIKTQLQKDRKFLEETNRDNKRLKLEKQKMSSEITNLQSRLTEHLAEANNAKDMTRTEVLKEMEPIVSLKDQKIEELQGLLKRLEFENSQLQAEVRRLNDQTSWQQLGSLEEARASSQAEDLSLKNKDISKQVTDAAKMAQETFDIERKDLEKRLSTACAERDKAVRDLKRLKQHLIEKEQADSEKMEQDSKHISELEKRADESITRAMRLEQSLAQTLQQQADASKKYNEQLEEANQEILTLKKKLAACVNALESKDGELFNLQAALGQYYAESETKDKLHMELSAAKKEVDRLSDQLKTVNNVLAMKDNEKGELLEKLGIQQKKVSESQEQTHKLEADVLMLRRALEQSLTRLNRMSSDSDYYVDRRIAIKLLVTYFQRQQSKEVLDLMSRMLGFSEEDKQMIGLAQQGAGKGVVRGVLGLPGRVVGGLLKTNSTPSVTSLSQEDNQSFSDLWIDFLLKESEEREKKDLKAAEASGSRNMHSSASSDAQRVQESSSLSSSDENRGKGEAFSTAKFASDRGPLENGFAARLNEADSLGSEFSNVPLNSSPSSSLARTLLHPRDVMQRGTG